MTLLEASKLSANRGEILNSSVAELYAGSSSILATLPFKNIAGLSERILREVTRPSASFRAINEGFTDSFGSRQDFTVSLAISGGNIDIDMVLMSGLNDADLRATETQAKVRALSLNWTRIFMKGDTAVAGQEKEFDGLQKRLGDPAFSSQVINAGNTAGGDALSLEKLDELLDQVEGDNKKLIMNKTMARRLTQASRNQAVGGYVVFTQPEFGRRVMTYNGVEILTIDKDNLNADILPFSEVNPGGGAAASASIYCADFSDLGVYGLTNGGIMVKDFGELDNGQIMRTKINWLTNYVIKDLRGAARLRGVKNAAIVA